MGLFETYPFRMAPYGRPHKDIHQGSAVLKSIFDVDAKTFVSIGFYLCNLGSGSAAGGL